MKIEARRPCRWIGSCLGFVLAGFLSAGAHQARAAETYYYTSNKAPYLKATGMGYYSLKYAREEARQRLMAERAARVDAYRKLSKAYGIVQRRVYGDAEETRVSGYIPGVQVIETRYYGNGKVEVDAVLPLDQAKSDRDKGGLDSEGFLGCEVANGPVEISKEEYEQLMH